jgi:UDP-N-acetyl-D-galactosamine dehydrogenase
MDTLAGAKKVTVCVIGTGYVGLPLARALAKNFKVIALDIDKELISELGKSNKDQGICFTSDASLVKTADYIIICVPTPLNSQKEPDLNQIKKAAQTISANLKKGAVVILESTVYPGLTEELLVPLLETSGLKAGKDFKVAYSPERINPGDDEHDISGVTKIVAGMDKDTAAAVAELYRAVTPKVYQADSIKIAEAAKIVENIQRDLNIALMNELAIVFNRMGLDTAKILEAAATKWNFNSYYPGLVGGHCIPVDSYYLVSKAEEFGIRPKLIIAGRKLNEYMPEYIANLVAKTLRESGKTVKKSRVIIMGLAYKENICDMRESPAFYLSEELIKRGCEVYGHDPLITNKNVRVSLPIPILSDMEDISAVKADVLIFTVAHNPFKKLSLKKLARCLAPSPILIDIRRIFDAEKATLEGFIIKSL